MPDRYAEAIAAPVSTDSSPAVVPLLPLRTRNLTLKIDQKRLVDAVDLTLTANKLTVVMGPNGAGKSLLLRLLHGLLEPTSGSMSWGDSEMSVAVRKRQAMVFQRPVLLRRSVAANIDFVVAARGAAARRRREQILDSVGLLTHARQPARLLSGGEQQRLSLARALAVEPEVLFLDEPTASLDPASVYMIEDIVRAAHRNGTKIVYVTHDLGQARRLADEIVFLHRGRLLEQSPAERFFDEPCSKAAKAYLDGRIVL